MSELLANLIDEVRDFGLEKVFRRYYGIYRAKVTDNKDQETRGRVKLIVPFFGEKELPFWAVPKDMINSGPGKGRFFPPDIDDFVYVEFEGGDPRFPVYSGGWFADTELPEEFAYGEDGAPAIRGFKNKYGHSVRFEETEESQKIVVQTPGGHFLVIDDSAEAENIMLIHKSGGNLQMKPNGDVILSAKSEDDNTNFLFLNAADGQATLTSKDGAFVSVTKEEVKIQDSSGESWATIGENGITLNTSKDNLINGNTFGVSVGGVDMRDVTKAGLVISNGQVALGNATIEVVDAIIQTIDALTQAPALVTTGVGPSSPIIPPASVQLGVLKGLLSALKGSL